MISGRNIWRADLSAIANRLDQVLPILKSKEILIAPSCSLMLVPQDVGLERFLDEQKKSWLAFARQKLEEIAQLRDYLNNPGQAGAAFLQNKIIISERKQYLESNLTAKRADEALKGSSIDFQRKSAYPVRQRIQKKRLGLPLLPTTTIGSFPQTPEVRKARGDFNKGEITGADYEQFLKSEVERTIRLQEEIGLDVLVHGEFERNDMVQYFAEKMEGFMFTQHGWVQSFGSRYVRPPIIYGAVSRPNPMTTAWTQYAQSLTTRPVKGMLTGPVTILQWSYARDDQPRSQTCMEIAHAIRKEVQDLEASGIAVIQIDEPALREGLPLRKEEWNDYLDWAVTCFRVASSGVKDETQIHTHMCYAEFNDIMPAISAMDADVISIEASRSGMQLLDAFRDFEYPNEVGPGIYDIHSPNIPSFEDMAGLLKKALLVISADKLWVNPDCGLKTRKWEEVLPSLTAMVNAAKRVREDIQG
jgi:5-methyltetrahydropteroyltriglutamate--homocysteine methyltransferase